MALIVLASASGSPGVTTTALGLALSWPRPVVLVDADPVGGSSMLAGYFRGDVAHTDAMVTLVMAHRDGRLGQALADVLMPIPGSQAWLLPGPRSHAQAGSLTELWGPLTFALRALERTGQDVIADVGQLGMAWSPAPLIGLADLALLVCRSDLPALAAARQWATSWSAAADDGTGASRAACLVVGEGRPYSAGEIARVLQIPVLERVAWDERSAAVISRGDRAPKTMAGRALGRSLSAVAAAIDASIAADRQDVPAGEVGVR